MSDLATQMEEQNRQKTIAAYERLFAGDFDGFCADFDENIQLFEPDALPYSGAYRGVEGAKKMIQAAMGTSEDFSFSVEQIAAAGDLVFIYVHMSGRAKKTGRTFSYPLVEMWRFRDGKVVEFRPFYWDTHQMREVYGV